jgi:DNA-binding PadR family transcriptional regulator
MANEKIVDQVILGLLQHESMTGYEIKRRIDSTLHFFWSASFGSIYPALNSLEKEGFVTKKNLTECSREKFIYTCTDSGKERLRNWLSRPAGKDELRYETLLKLFFSAGTGKETAVRHIDRFESKIRQSLPYLEKSVEELRAIREQSDDHVYYMLTALFGVMTYRTYLDWCEEAKRILGFERSEDI